MSLKITLRAKLLRSISAADLQLEKIKVKPDTVWYFVTLSSYACESARRSMVLCATSLEQLRKRTGLLG